VPDCTIRHRTSSAATAAIDDGRRAASVERALATARAAAREPAPPELKRAPRGYPLDHPRIERLRMKEITVYRRHPLEPWLHTPAAGGPSAPSWRPRARW